VAGAVDHTRGTTNGCRCKIRKPEDPATPDNPLAGQLVRSVDDARAAVREQIARGADWIKLYPAINYSFTPTGEVKYTLTYPMPVLQALIDETHRRGHKVACHVFGGEGEVRIQNRVKTASY
jgi:imidazolonepropionase-like amidohydrolase